MSKIFITDYISDPSIEKSVLGNVFTSTPSKDMEVALVWHQKVNKEFLDQYPKLKGVVRYGVGYDNIDLNECKARDIVFCNTPDYGVDEVADTAIAMAMNFIRGISEYDSLSKNFKDGSWQENTIKRIRRTSSVRFGVIGAGRIGGNVLLKAKALGFQTAFFDPYLSSGVEKVYRAERFYSMTDLLSQMDVISLHCPLNSETKNLVNADFVSKLKPGAILINTARGGLIESLENFVQPIRNGQLTGLGLDVLPSEPPKDGPFIQAWRGNDQAFVGKVIINPHSAYFSQEAYIEMRTKAAQNALRILNGERPLNIISA